MNFEFPVILDDYLAIFAEVHSIDIEYQKAVQIVL